MNAVSKMTERYESLLRSVRPCLSECLHLARKALRKKASTVAVPFVAVVSTNPLGIRVADLTNENDARSVAPVVAAVVMFHGLEGPPLTKWRGTPRPESYRDAARSVGNEKTISKNSAALVRASSLGMRAGAARSAPSASVFRRLGFRDFQVVRASFRFPPAKLCVSFRHDSSLGAVEPGTDFSRRNGKFMAEFGDLGSTGSHGQLHQEAEEVIRRQPILCSAELLA